LWQFLVWLSQKFGCEIEQGRLIDFDSSGNGRGNTRVSVTRMLQQFEDEGMLLRHQRRLIISLQTSGKW